MNEFYLICFLLQEIRSALLCVSCADNARAGQGGDGTGGGAGPILPHHLLQVRGLWTAVVVRVGGTGLLSAG